MPRMTLDGNVFLKIEGCLVLWEQLTSSETTDAGKEKWYLKLAVPPTHPDFHDIDAMADECLHDSQFKGVLPRGGNMPASVLTAADYDGQFDGWKVFTASTVRGQPDIYVDNKLSDIMQAGSLFFTGQYVGVLVHCFEYNNKQKGIAFGLDGVNVERSKKAVRLQLGDSKRVDTSAAFSGQTQTASAPPPAANTAPPPPANGAPPPPVERRQTATGGFTRDQLLAAGYTDAQIDALPLA
jgi:hypothetical protein